MQPAKLWLGRSDLRLRSWPWLRCCLLLCRQLELSSRLRLHSRLGCCSSGRLVPPCALPLPRPGSCPCRRSASLGPMWEPTGRPASCRPSPSSNETSESGAHVTSESTRQGKFRNNNRALLDVHRKETPAVRAGWVGLAGLAGRWGPSTRAVTQRGRSGRESCTCAVRLSLYVFESLRLEVFKS